MINISEGRRFCLGDIHGGFLGLKEVFEYSKFDYDKDLLIFLGDIVDGWSDTKACIEELMKVKNLVFIRGNHDIWFMEYYSGEMEEFSDYYTNWIIQGGKETLLSFDLDKNNIKKEHIEFFEKSVPYYKLEDMFFTHGGFNIYEPISYHFASDFAWNRTLIEQAFNNKDIETVCKEFKEIYVGHTPTIKFGNEFKTPVKWANVWAMDTGACFSGKLSMMDIDSKEVFQSKELMFLYPTEKGRNKMSMVEMIMNSKK